MGKCHGHDKAHVQVKEHGRIGHDKPHVQLQEPGQLKAPGRIRHDKAQGACKMAPGARLCKAMAIA